MNIYDQIFKNSSSFEEALDNCFYMAKWSVMAGVENRLIIIKMFNDINDLGMIPYCSGDEPGFKVMTDGKFMVNQELTRLYVD